MSPSGSSPSRLGFFALLALGINGIVGVGIFFTPNKIAALLPGPLGALAYVFTSLALVPIAWVYATLAARFDEDGGPYVWARAAFGPGAGFFVGWITFVSSLFATATVILGICQYLAPSLGFVTPFAQLGFGWVSVGLLSAVVALGLRPSAWAWSALTVAKLLPLLLLVGLYFVGTAPSHPAAPSDGASWSDVGRSMLIAVFPLQGFEIVALVAGSAKGSRLNVPRATLLSLAFAAVLYVILQLACARGVPLLALTEAPLPAAARAFGGNVAEGIVAAGANVSALGIAFGMIAMTPRYLAALGKNDGLGGWLGVETSRSVPLRALVISVAAILALISVGAFGAILVLASLAVLVQFAVCAASLAKLAFCRQHGLKRRQLWPAPLALIAIVLIAESARLDELWILCGVLAVGAILFAVRARLAVRLAGPSGLS
jgi:basic amino acid/polyamine antiporter, APA family